jgi:hypothetical protein
MNLPEKHLKERFFSPARIDRLKAGQIRRAIFNPIPPGKVPKLFPRQASSAGGIYQINLSAN